ncbi:thioredoxin domain-containing protein [Trichophyton mentagrophytes]|nr:putative NTP binding protein [Trichophyton interdigitale]KAG5219063.1 putative NTP binding protein [Trichophyton interdigitale]KAG8205405.1 putative NTP binding protein [Trichophyton interdigitale]GBF62209.1 thioredoxin domain-containing protein [Trichophyton mentagrophytes]
MADEQRQKRDAEEEDEEDLLAALEAEEDDPKYRANRIKQLQSELSDTKSNAQQSNNTTHDAEKSEATSLSTGTDAVVTTMLNNSLYPTLPNDQSLLDFSTQIHRCVIHFFHPDFARCSIMDKHLTTLSEAHNKRGKDDARFARVDVRNVPFIVEKLKIRVLPCVLGFIDGAVVERITGFEGLVDMNALMGKKGSEKTTGEDFKTSMLEYRLVQTKLLKNAVLYGDNADDYDDDDRDDDEDNERTGKRKTIRTGKTMRRRGGEDDEDDWD